MTYYSEKYTAGVEISSDVFLDQILVNFIIQINYLLNHIWNLYQFIIVVICFIQFYIMSKFVFTLFRYRLQFLHESNAELNRRKEIGRQALHHVPEVS